MEYSKGGDALKVRTRFGDLIASVGYDEDYPEIYIHLDTDMGAGFTLALIGQDNNGKYIAVRTKEELGDEDFTNIKYFTDDVIFSTCDKLESE